MKAVREIRCEKADDTDYFNIFWEYDFNDSIKEIWISEIDFAEPKFHLDKYNTVRKVPTEKNCKICTTKSTPQHRFLVIGIESKDNNPAYNNVAEWCRNSDITKISCIGLSVQGKIEWKSEINDKKATISLKSEVSADIPYGYLFYSYQYCGQTFTYAIPNTIMAGQKENFSFYIPSGASNIKLLQKGTQVSLNQEFDNEQGFLQRVKNFFKK